MSSTGVSGWNFNSYYSKASVSAIPSPHVVDFKMWSSNQTLLYLDPVHPGVFAAPNNPSDYSRPFYVGSWLDLGSAVLSTPTSMALDQKNSVLYIADGRVIWSSQLAPAGSTNTHALDPAYSFIAGVTRVGSTRWMRTRPRLNHSSRSTTGAQR